ncbi:MAG: bifunctional [glutamate--ammonia ligase]-adenylyl-L-tyrosine phosphorylase/[glutamate--ammonia-ligase] adenylyltransferase [Nitrospinae bacterium CG11_big_fil_rev_8_21_14_0_20_45_15]|nr:MAG: bifunctional [glutamate--ammonia ligase]-adenylyl-L-tyrosine phosphorylase/[glutamate--ammonia-ligase] adenylyltransferase [Nitrospinae bacterium CG11_big_fil_rev_8_21_14_0_20_45_15]
MNTNIYKILSQNLLGNVALNEELEKLLRECAFENPSADWKEILRISKQCNFTELYPTFFADFFQFLKESFDSNIALKNFSRFSDLIADKNHFYSLLTTRPDFHKNLIFLFSGSQVLTDTLFQNPSLIDWLRLPEVLSKSKNKDAFQRDYYELAGDYYNTDRTPTLLRQFKKREYLRVGLRDLLGLASFEETAGDITRIADVAMQVAYEYADHVCQKKYGVPYYEDLDGKKLKAEFAILGMGKLGGQELNYSSDIDLIYIYTSSKGETQKEGEGSTQQSITNHEYFTKLSQIVTKTLHEITSEGNVFRVDLDLRPEGKSGEIVNSLASCEIYYQSWGRTWERQALIKARVSAGSEALGKQFFDRLEPFIYKRSLDFSSIDEIKAMKQKINLSLQRKSGNRTNIKLGFGGIREIEFIVQSYQLIFGGRNTSLRVSNTLAVLKRLCEREFIEKEDYIRLRDAYIFLRNLENRVQISFGLQTHDLPDEEKPLRALARKMGIKATPKDAPTALMEIFRFHTEYVGAQFTALLADKENRDAAENASLQWSQAAERETMFSLERVEECSFKDPQRTFKFLEALREGAAYSHPTEKSIQNFDFLFPKILRFSENAPNPNSAVENWVKFIESSGARESYLSLFKSNEKFLELILMLFGSSDFLSEILIKQPGTIDVAMDMEAIYRFKSPEKIRDELKAQLEFLKDFSAKKLALRRFKQGEELRCGLRYLIGEQDIMAVLEDLSNLADVFIQTVYNLAFEELNSKTGEPLQTDFAIFVLGKHGGRELNFGSDLDVIFVYDLPDETLEDHEVAELSAHYSSWSQLIFSLTSEVTTAGVAYKMDADLRPDGGGGSLVMSFEGYRDYFKNRARIWERQAMTRARFVAGKPELGEKFRKLAQEFTYSKKLEYGELIEISRLRERMVVELAQESKKGLNVKLGSGGLADIEFILQIMLLKYGSQYPKLRLTNSLDALLQFAQSGLLDEGTVLKIKDHFLFLRRLECVLRLWNPNSKNYLPKDSASLIVVARLLGYSGSDEETSEQLLADYEKHSTQVRAFYNKTLDYLLRTSL